MKSKTKYIRFFSIILTIFLTNVYASAQQGKDYNTLSEDFLSKIKNGEDVSAIQQELANSSLEDLENALRTDEEKLAFWVNIYNGYIQLILSDTPELYNDRRDFFSREQITIAGETVSFAKIEHGIIRKSQWPLGLGLIRKWFPNKFERKLRVDTRDYRVHFALNCGAKDCPPVAIYNPKKLNEQFNKGTKEYLMKTSSYNSESKNVAVTSLFNWFRGDFGCKKGVKKILKANNIIPTTKDIDITYKNYDWTLDLDNWTNL
ncbi:protein of unknown function DUF547 [Cellulophaga algicola DSM 14237]|uniref:DUF547 domain-containing protein n=1 Tax=Cellulophaga algicola (strain DSM 14237 / IC166 / ACAM 630) TaxID=688270 RepID=E6X7U5_CELAD|nr:DUF547 domain-containing protein [Cellulophaga algicola]ADV47538.1 protein of unknown function DUF547 [Cellulophaga algicola DSM 14237]